MLELKYEQIRLKQRLLHLFQNEKLHLVDDQNDLARFDIKCTELQCEQDHKQKGEHVQKDQDQDKNKDDQDHDQKEQNQSDEHPKEKKAKDMAFLKLSTIMKAKSATKCSVLI